MRMHRYLEDYEYREYHEALVAAAPQRAYAAMRSLDLGRSRLIRAIFALRDLPARLRGASSPDRARGGLRSLVDSAVAIGWSILEEVPDQELVAGAVTQPWQIAVTFRGLPGEEFMEFAEPGFAKIVWNFAVHEVDPGVSLVSTETRVATTDAFSRRQFRRYWLFLAPGIRLIRLLAIGLLKRELEREREELDR